MMFPTRSSSNDIVMQGLLSYSDEEDEATHLSSAIANGSKLQSKPPTDSTLLPSTATTTTTASSSTIPSLSKPKSHLPPNVIRRIPSSQPTSSSSNTPNETHICSPLRKDPHSSGQNHPESPDPIHLGHIGPGEGEEFETEEETLRRLVQPAPLKDGNGWDEAYGLGRRDMGSTGVDPNLQAKVTQFLNLKAQGTHFNDSLMKSRAFRNPTIYKKLVEFVDVDERRGFRKSIWDWDQGESKEWSAEKIADLQKTYSQRPSQPRTNIPFTSSTSSSSTSSVSSSSRPYPISNISKNPPARGVVESGGKPYAFVGMDSLSGGIREPKRERDRPRDREKDRRDDKRTRWG